MKKIFFVLSSVIGFFVFAYAQNIANLATNADHLNNQPASYYAPASQIVYSTYTLDSQKLGGQLPSYYLPVSGGITTGNTYVSGSNQVVFGSSWNAIDTNVISIFQQFFQNGLIIYRGDTDPTQSNVHIINFYGSGKLGLEVQGPCILESSVSVSGQFLPQSASMATWKATAPIREGAIVFDSTNISIIQGTSTAVGAWAVCGSSWIEPRGW